MVRDTVKKDILPLVILKFMEHSANPNYYIDLGPILYRNICAGAILTIVTLVELGCLIR